MESSVKPKDKPKTSQSTPRKRTSNEVNQNVFTELDESELLCLPNFNKKSSLQSNESKIHNKYPENYCADEYRTLKTPEERRKYRNSKDLRKKIPNKTEQIGKGICFSLFRGERCQNQTCIYGHEFRLPKKLRICKDWKKGFCANGQFCYYLHSEFPCLFHYLGLENTRHDPKICPYYHGGPLCEEYEEMFLGSINLKHYPLANEMYKKNQLVQLKKTECNSKDAVREVNTFCDISTRNRQQTPQIQSIFMSLGEQVTEARSDRSSETVVENVPTDTVVCQPKVPASGESSLSIDEKHLVSASVGCQQKAQESYDESKLQIDESGLQIDEGSDENGLQIDEGSNANGLQIDDGSNENCLQIDDGSKENSLQIDEKFDESSPQIDEEKLKSVNVAPSQKDQESSDESSLMIDE